MPNDPCHVGAETCSAGCQDTGAPIADGIACGAGKYCKAGACVVGGCGSRCGMNDGCMEGVVRCGSGTPTCEAQGRVLPDGTACAGGACKTGMCAPACVVGASVYAPGQVSYEANQGCLACDPLCV